MMLKILAGIVVLMVAIMMLLVGVVVFRVRVLALMVGPTSSDFSRVALSTSVGQSFWCLLYSRLARSPLLSYKDQIKDKSYGE